MLALPLIRGLFPTVARRTFSASALRLNASSNEQLDGERLIEAKLVETFSPCQVKVQDVSGAQFLISQSCIMPMDPRYTGGCGTFYAINISSPAFAGLSIVKQHRLVTEALKQEVPGMHGLQVIYDFNEENMRDILTPID